MQGNDSSTDDSFSLPADATTTPASLEIHSDDGFEAELRDLEVRLEQLELEQRSLRIQLQRARLRSVERNTAPSSAPPTTHLRQQQPSVHPTPTPRRTPCHAGRNNPYARPVTTTLHCDTDAHTPEQYSSHQFHPTQTQAPEHRTPQAGDRLDATGQVLRIGDKVSFLATNYTAGGTATVRRFTATFVILRRDNGGEVRRAPSNITRIHSHQY